MSRPEMAAGFAPAVSARARRLWRDAISVDMHNDLPSKLIDGFDAAVRHEPSDGHTDVPRLAESGLTAVFLAAWVDAPCAATPGASFARAMREIDAIHALVDRHAGVLRFATSADDVRRAKADGRVAILIGVEGGHALENSLERLAELHARGARYLTLTWNNGNDWAGSSIGSGGTRTAGLTDFGRRVIAELERLGMLVDISHVSTETFWDVMGIASRPVIASHSSARALANHPRNLDDAQLRAVAESGGVVNVNFYPRFIDARWRAAVDAATARTRAELGEPDAADAAARAAFDRRRRELVAAIPPVPVAVLVDHIEHIARVAGHDHVGLGSDFDGISATPAGMEDVTALPRIVQALLDRGWAEDDVRKLVGGNMLRVLDGVGRG